MSPTSLKLNYENNEHFKITSRTTRLPSAYHQWYAYHRLKNTELNGLQHTDLYLLTT